MTPQARILELLSGYTSKQPLKRADLLKRLKLDFPEITDREMREIYEEMPEVISNSRGIYMPQTIEEVKEFKAIAKKYALSHFRRALRVEKAFIERMKNEKVEPKIEYKVDEVGQSVFC